MFIMTQSNTKKEMTTEDLLNLVDSFTMFSPNIETKQDIVTTVIACAANRPKLYSEVELIGLIAELLQHHSKLNK